MQYKKAGYEVIEISRAALDNKQDKFFTTRSEASLESTKLTEKIERKI